MLVAESNDMCSNTLRNATLPGSVASVYSIPRVRAPFPADKSHNFLVSQYIDWRAGPRFGSSDDVITFSSLTILTHKHTHVSARKRKQGVTNACARRLSTWTGFGVKCCSLAAVGMLKAAGVNTWRQPVTRTALSDLHTLSSLSSPGSALTSAAHPVCCHTITVKNIMGGKHQPVPKPGTPRHKYDPHTTGTRVKLIRLTKTILVNKQPCWVKACNGTHQPDSTE